MIPFTARMRGSTSRAAGAADKKKRVAAKAATLSPCPEIERVDGKTEWNFRNESPQHSKNPSNFRSNN